MEVSLRAVCGLTVVVVALIWIVRRWRMRRTRTRAEAARRTARTWDIKARPGLKLSRDERAFLRALRNSDYRVRGTAVLLSVWDLYCVIRRLPRGALESVLAEQLATPEACDELRLRRGDDRRQLTLLYAVASAMRRGGFRLSVVGEAFELTDDAVEVRIERGGKLRITPKGPLSPSYPIEHGWVRGPHRWPRRPLDHALRAAGSRAARVPEATRRLLSSQDPLLSAPLDAAPFVASLVMELEVKALERAAVTQRCGSRKALSGCGSAQLALLLCCAARVAGRNPGAHLLPFEFNGVQALATRGGLVPNDAWTTTEIGAPSASDREPEPGFGLRPASALGSLCVAAVVEAVSGRPWLATLFAVLWGALEVGRAYLGSRTKDEDWVAEAIPRLAGIASGAAYAVIYVPGMIIAAIALALGVGDPNEIAYLAVIPYAGFVLGLVGQLLLLRRHPAWVRRVRTVQLVIQTGSLFAASLAPAVQQTAVWIGLASVAASVGVLLKSEATAEQNALRGTRGKPLAGMNIAFVGTVGLLLLAPSLIPETARPVLLGLAPARAIFLALAVLSLASWRLLPKVLEVMDGTWQPQHVLPLHSRTLWRNVGLTALTLAAQVGPLNRLNEVFIAHGSADPVRWTAVLNISIIATAASMPVWDKLLHRNRRRAETLAVLATVSAPVIGLLSEVLHVQGFWWYTMISASVIVMDAGVTYTWVCAEAEALTNAEDVGRAALVNAGRYSVLVIAGIWAAGAGQSELNSVWLPALAFSLGAALLLSRGAPDVRPGEARNS
jgi:hypothetical protein